MGRTSYVRSVNIWYPRKTFFPPLSPIPFSRAHSVSNGSRTFRHDHNRWLFPYRYDIPVTVTTIIPNDPVRDSKYGTSDRYGNITFSRFGRHNDADQRNMTTCWREISHRYEWRRCRPEHQKTYSNRCNHANSKSALIFDYGCLSYDLNDYISLLRSVWRENKTIRE